MTSQLDHIISNLKTCFDGKPWYGVALMKKLQVINWQLVNELHYGQKSIAILIQHIINWRIFVVRKLENDVEYDLVIDTENDWTTISINNEEDWQKLIASLQQTQTELIELLSTKTDDLLDQQVPGKTYKFGPILRSIAQHDIYHLGQIAMLYRHIKN